ncbi:MAG: energy transducer TonB [Candidatus Scalinduaceae bacterium]
MLKKDLFIAGLIALALHLAALVMTSNVTSEPEVIFKKGESSLKMHLIPSIASIASTESVNDIQEDVHKIEEKAVENPKPLQKQENPKGERVKVEENIEQKQKEVTYSTEYFKTQNEVNIKQSQIQKKDTTIKDSKEIIADVKEKGVLIGAMIKNVFKPVYPLSCKRRGHEGTTVLEVTIQSNGKCANIDILSSAGCKSLDKAARQALKKAAFIPAKRLGVPFTTIKKIAFNFKLEDYK